MNSDARDVDGQEPAFDIFFSYARADNHNGAINQLVAAIETEYARFFPGKALHNFFDTRAIENGEDWRNRLYTSLKRSRIMIALLSANYLASPWCRREWQAWCDIERGRGWLSYMLQPIYYVDVPGGEARVEDFMRNRDLFLGQITGYAGAVSAEQTVRFEENECLAEVMSRQAIDLKPWYSDGESALRSDEIRLRLERLVKSLDKKISLSVRGEHSSTNIPRHNRQFCGRIHELKSIRQCFAERETGLVPVLHGLGGEGKSSLAFAYAHAFAYDYPGGRRQVSCEGAVDLAQCFIRLGEECGLDMPPDNAAEPGASKAARFGAVWNWLASRPQGRTLVILDNIDRPDLLAQSSLVSHIQATDALHVLATTRCDRQSIGPAAFPLAVHGLPLRDAVSLLESFRPAEGAEQEAVRRLAVLLGGHALSLELAGAFIQSNPEMSWAEYAGFMAENMLSTLEDTREQSAALVPYAGTRLRQVEQLAAPMLAQRSELELQALALASLLAPEAVVEPWIRETLLRLCPDGMRKKGLVDPWARLKRSLAGLCLWQEGEAEGIVRMHRLVREVVRRRFLDDSAGSGPEKLAEYALLLRVVAQEAILTHIEGRAGWKFHHFAALPPTLRAWLAEEGHAPSTLPLPVPLYHHILRWSGRSEEGLALTRDGLAVAAALGDPEERDRWTAAYSMLEGHLRRGRGDLGSARAAYARALSLLDATAEARPDGKRILLERAHCLDYAGALESAAGDPAAGAAFHRRSLALLDECDEAGAELRQERAYTMDHLACALAEGERAEKEEAFALFQAALKTRAALLEADPDNTRKLRDYGISLDFMGDRLAERGQTAEAEERYGRSLDIREKLCALDPHSLTFLRDLSISLNKIGDMRRKASDPAAALNLYQKALTIRSDLTLADKENLTLWHDCSASQLRLGDALAEMGRWEEALAHYRDALHIRRKCGALLPGNPGFIYGQAACLERVVEARAGAGDAGEAALALNQARDVLRGLPPEEEASARRAGFFHRLDVLEQGLGGAQAARS